MGQSFAQKALARAAGRRCAQAGEIVDVRPDRVLSHDNTAAIARLFHELGATRLVNPERLVVVLDHAVPAPTAEHALNHDETRRFVAQQAVTAFFEVGRGICHQVVSEEALVLPGQMILGADSHTTHLGWLGAFAAGIGRSEVAALWATGELWMRVPETIRIDLTGRLPDGVTAKDVSLWLLRELGQEAGIYHALEFGGRGLSTLSVESRMVLPNMMAEAGAKNAYLTPDEAIFNWLALRYAARTRRPVNECLDKIAGSALYPDGDAAYVATRLVDLSQLEPLVSCPHSPANAVPLSQVRRVSIQQAFIGTCTNGRLEDLAEAARVLKGAKGRVRRIASGTRLLVIPASNQVLREAISAGYIDTFLAAGAMLGTPGCGPCMGNHLGVPAAGEVVLSTANRNFRGRMGNPESEVYLASPAVVAASAITGMITDPREIIPGPCATGRTGGNGDTETLRHRVTASRRHSFTPSMCPPVPATPCPGVAPTARADSRGAAAIHPREEDGVVIQGRAWKYGDDVNTDAIFPGKYTYTVRDPVEMARHALEDLDPRFASRVRPGDIIVAGRNWGSGSSREQAVTCLLAAGVAAVIAASFARIYYRNAVNNGLLPIVCPEAASAIQPGETVTVDWNASEVRCAAGAFAFPPASESVRHIIDAGGLLAMLRQERLCT